MMPKTVRIYTTSSCPYCKQAKAFFEGKKVVYSEINVEQNDDAAREMIEKTGQMGVPVIEIDGIILIGFDKKALEQALAV